MAGGDLCLRTHIAFARHHRRSSNQARLLPRLNIKSDRPRRREAHRYRPRNSLIKLIIRLLPSPSFSFATSCFQLSRLEGRNQFPAVAAGSSDRPLSLVPACAAGEDHVSDGHIHSGCGSSGGMYRLRLRHAGCHGHRGYAAFRPRHFQAILGQVGLRPDTGLSHCNRDDTRRG